MLQIPDFSQIHLDLRSLDMQLNFGAVSSQLLGWGVFQPKWWRNYLHSHSFFEVCYVYQGKGRFRINDQQIMVKRKDLFLARPGEVHEIVADEADPMGIYFWSFTLSPEASQIVTSSKRQDLLSAFLTGSSKVASADLIEPVLQLITSELNMLDSEFAPAVRGLSYKLIIDVMRLFSDDSQELREMGNMGSGHILDLKGEITADVIQFLHDNFHLPIRVRDVAAQIHLSERHANRQFKQLTGRPIMTFLTEIRIDKAKSLLLNPNLSIGEVAVAVGIEDQRYFASLFRKHTNLSPTAYRKQKGTEFLKRGEAD